jgi:hypothetical protein
MNALQHLLDATDKAPGRLGIEAAAREVEFSKMKDSAAK